MLDSRVIAQLTLGIGIAFAAFIGGHSLIEFKRLDQTVSVKGLAERLVKANEARARGGPMACPTEQSQSTDVD